MREEETEVLVVGAGPVGLWTALLLGEAGVRVGIVDRESRTAARSYACALHPRTLKLLQRIGLADAVLARGRRVQTMAFYDRESRRAEIKFSELGGEFPFLLLVPQNALEQVLEQRLRQKGITVRWNHRFDSLRVEPDAVVANVEELGGTATGYIVPHWETIVKNRIPIRASFLVGADGHNSVVRQRLGIESERVAGPYFFAAYEFESEAQGEDEVRVVLDDATTNVIWPLPEGKFRWTFQVTQADEGPNEFPEKERRAFRFAQETMDEEIRQYVHKVARHRAPWFSAGVKKIAWCTEVVFEHRLAKHFGAGRCWLAGDAAHQTGPVGVQSMNAGFSEAEVLTGCLRRILRENAPVNLLETYEREARNQWRRLLGLAGGLKTTGETNPWVRERSAKILPCLPGTEDDLVRLARQLKVDLA
jgi:2-polyprenyl-6-methoxyphenol hydroxylase-like FAD-dependent oxidoreductase